MNTQTKICPHGGILHSQEKEWAVTLTTVQMDLVGAVLCERSQAQEDTQCGLHGSETPRTGDTTDRKCTQGSQGWGGDR